VQVRKAAALDYLRQRKQAQHVEQAIADMEDF
jgi:hypothetical protein